MVETIYKNVRKITVHKITYSKYCAKCKFGIDAKWHENNGVKFGILIVTCCANGGACDSQKHSRQTKYCPYGVVDNVCLGESLIFNPEQLGEKNYPIVEDHQDEESNDKSKDKLDIGDYGEK